MPGPRVKSLMGALGLMGLVAGGGVIAGCDTLNAIGPEICRRPNTPDPLNYCGGEITGDTYMSGDWNGELLYFPGGGFFRLHHRLGERPTSIQLYLSFNENGVQPDPEGGFTGSIAQAAGNQAEIKRVTDEYVDVVNGSCIDYFLLAVISADRGEGGAGGAGGSDDPFEGFGGEGGFFECSD